MRYRKLIQLLILILAINFSLNLCAEEIEVNPKQLINAYGFNTWNLENTSCQSISSEIVKQFKSCLNQGNKKTAYGNYTQYKCTLKNNKQMFLYKNKNICFRQYHSLYIEGF